MICQHGIPDNEMKCLATAKCQKAHCSICQRGLYADELCFKCKNGYLNTLAGCVRQTKKITSIEGCSLYTADMQKCDRCRLGFFILSDGKCTENVFNQRFGVSGKNKFIREASVLRFEILIKFSLVLLISNIV